MAQKTIGVIGGGIVGGAVKSFFPDAKVYDKFKDLDAIEEVGKCRFIFISVPTPYNGRLDLSITDDAAANAVRHLADPENQLIVIKSTIAGVVADDIDVSITSDMITIKGKRVPDETIDASDYYHQELYWGPFSRSVILPEDIDVEKAAASMKNGILTIRLPKLAKSRMKKVKISS